MDRIFEMVKSIKEKYGDNAIIYVKDTVEKLCEKGIAKSCFDDYGLLANVVEVLTIFENLVANA